ncbi:MAG: sugar ABC transporter permease [Firmicutes bacterium]|nr:sugar ABC transporter permease [Bacillota bacterium]
MFSQRIKWWFITPMLVFLFLWNVLPLLWVVGLSFYNYSVLKGGTPRFVGFLNYLLLHMDPYMWERFRTTFLFVLLAVALELVIGFVLGFFFNQKIKGKKYMLPLIFVPMIVAPVAAGVFFRFIYDPHWGIINYFLNTLFGFRLEFLEDAALAMPAVVAVDVWMWSPFMMLMCLAGLQAVPKHLYEAAEIDRLSWWTQFRYIVLPHIKPVLVLAVLLRTIDAFKIFDIIFVMTGGGPGSATEVLPMTLYRNAFLFWRTGSASALAVVLLLIAVAFTSLYLLLIPRPRTEG